MSKISEALKAMSAARKRVADEIASNSRRGFYAAGLASEGYAGGYRDALNDIDALLTHGRPNDRRGYWRDLEQDND